MKGLILLFLGCLMSFSAIGQIVQLKVGSSFSELQWRESTANVKQVYGEKFVGYSIFAGVDYLEKKHFNLSSNIGLIRKGGKREVQMTDQNNIPTGVYVIEKPILDYISLNTTIEVKYPFGESFSPFISVGPRIDYLIKSSEHFDSLEAIDELNKTSTGLLIGGGFKYNLEKIQLGLRADHYLSFNRVAEWSENNRVRASTFSINLTLGFKI